MSTTELYYTNQRLNDTISEQELYDFDTGTGHYPLDRLQFTSLPPAVGALTLPPMGQYSTPVDVTGGPAADTAASPSHIPLYALAALVGSYLLFLPM